MAESPSSAASAMIEAVRRELNHFKHRQRDPAVLLRCADIDGYLARASQGQDEPWLRGALASKAEKLAAAIRNAKFGNRSQVMSVMIEVSSQSA